VKIMADLDIDLSGINALGQLGLGQVSRAATPVTTGQLRLCPASSSSSGFSAYSADLGISSPSQLH
jgi:hypothetical protein